MPLENALINGKRIESMLGASIAVTETVDQIMKEEEEHKVIVPLPTVNIGAP